MDGERRARVGRPVDELDEADLVDLYRLRRIVECDVVRSLADPDPARLAAATRTFAVSAPVPPRMRERIWKSNPFITDITVISAMTLMAMHTMDTVEMKEMNWLRRLARV